MSDKLRERVEACPFCGAVYDKENGVEHDDGCFFLVLDMWRVGPCDGERAMRAWNRRSLPAPREEEPGLREALVEWREQAKSIYDTPIVTKIDSILALRGTGGGKMKIRRLELNWFWSWPWEWRINRQDLLGIVFIDIGPLMITWWAYE